VGLVGEFLTRHDACVQGILRIPEAHKFVCANDLRALVRKVPAALYDECASEVATVYCILRTSGEPEKWRQPVP
jgi:hypothetical protein